MSSTLALKNMCEWGSLNKIESNYSAIIIIIANNEPNPIQASPGVCRGGHKILISKSRICSALARVISGRTKYL